MTVSTTTNTVTYLGNGATTSFTFPFIGVSASDLTVSIVNPTGTIVVLGPTQYIVALNAVPVGGLWGIGGTVTYPTFGTPLQTGYSITITRGVPYTQDVSISNQGSFYPQSVETGLDELELQIQQVNTEAELSIKFPISGGVFPDDLPSALDRADTVLGFDDTGAITLYPVDTGVIPPVIPDPITFDNPVTAQVSAPAGTETVGTRYLVKYGTGTFLNESDKVAELTSTGWVFSDAPVNNQLCQVGPILYQYAYFADAAGYIWRAANTPRKTKWDAGQYFILEGDSIGAGSSASSPSVNGFAQLVATRYGVSLVNNSVGGKTTYQALVSAYATPNIHYRGSWPNGNHQIYMQEAGHNDALYAASSPVLPASVAGNDLTWWTKICAKTAVAASTLTLSAGWTSIGGVLCMASAQLGGDGKTSATVGATIGGSFTGDNIVIWTYASDAAVARMKPFTLTVDGSVVATYAGDGQYDNPPNDSNVNGLCPRAFVYSGAGSGSHTFVITVASGTGSVYIDSVGTLLEPDRAPPVVFLLPPRPLDYDIPPGGGSSEYVFESVDIARQNWIKAYSQYPISIARPNDWLNPANYNIDGEHPNTAGHLEIAEAIDQVTIQYGDQDAGSFTPSINAWTISGSYTTSALFQRNGNVVSFQIILAPSAGVQFQTTVATSNVSLVPYLPFGTYSGFAEVINVTDSLPLGVGIIKSDSNGGGVYMPAINVTDKQVAIVGTYTTN